MQGKIKGGYQPPRQAAVVYGLAANGGPPADLPVVARSCERKGYDYRSAFLRGNTIASRINTERAVEDELRVRPGGGRRQAGGAAGSHWEFRGKAAGHRLHRLGRSGSGGGSGGDPRQQRVVVRAAYTVHKAGGARGVLTAHTRYLARDSASLDGREGRFYDAREEGVDARQRVRAWEADRHHFRFIVSPENAAEIDRRPGGLAGYVREVMARVERDLGTKLEWAAITHHNTDDLHAHVLVRGRRDDGTDLVLPRQYLQHGMRQRVSTMAGEAVEYRESYSGPRASVVGGRRSVSQSEHVRPLLTPGQVRTLPYDEQLVFVTGFRPFRTPKLRYYEWPDLAGRVTDPPPMPAGGWRPAGSAAATDNWRGERAKGDRLPMPSDLLPGGDDEDDPPPSSAPAAADDSPPPAPATPGTFY